MRHVPSQRLYADDNSALLVTLWRIGRGHAYVPPSASQHGIAETLEIGRYYRFSLMCKLRNQHHFEVDFHQSNGSYAPVAGDLCIIGFTKIYL